MNYEEIYNKATATTPIATGYDDADSYGCSLDWEEFILPYEDKFFHIIKCAYYDAIAAEDCEEEFNTEDEEIDYLEEHYTLHGYFILLSSKNTAIVKRTEIHTSPRIWVDDDTLIVEDNMPRFYTVGFNSDEPLNWA